jgi:hypothetical protein
MGGKGRYIFLLLGALIFIAAGCENPFSMRKAETPGGNQSDWQPAYSPSQLIENFTNAISERDNEKYRRCLLDTAYTEKRFVFVPDPAVLESHAPTFAEWSIDKEVTVMRQVFLLVPADSLCRLVFTETIQEIVSPDTAVSIRQYRLDLHHTQTGLPDRYEGQITFRLAEDMRGEWVIYRWEDRGNVVGESTWSFLKASLGG